MNISVRQLRLFLDLFDSKSFTVAASRLHMTQSAASKSIAELESQLGYDLFDRTTRRVEPKESAREFYPYALEIMATLHAATRSVSDVAGLKRGRIGIAASPMMLGGLLAPIIARYQVNYPGILFDLYESSTDESVDRVRSGTVDFGFGLTPPETADIQSRAVLELGLWVLFGEKHPLRERQSVSLGELTQWNHIRLRRRFSASRVLDELLESRHIHLPGTVEIDTPAAAFGLVRSGVGILILPGHSAAPAGEQGIRALPINDTESTVLPISVFQRRKGRLSVAASSFLEELIVYLDELSPSSGSVRAS